MQASEGSTDRALAQYDGEMDALFVNVHEMIGQLEVLEEDQPRIEARQTHIEREQLLLAEKFRRP